MVNLKKKEKKWQSAWSILEEQPNKYKQHEIFACGLFICNQATFQ